MSAEPCEGGCGCLLSSLGHRGAVPGLWEWALETNGQRRALWAQHDAWRCRVIRTLRDAAQHARPDLAVMVMASGPNVFHVVAHGPAGWLESTWGNATVLRNELAGVARNVAGYFTAPYGLQADPPPWPVIAQNPHDTGHAASLTVRTG